MSQLLVTPMTPALSSGAGLRTYGVVAALARHGPVEVVYATFGAARPDPAYDRLDGVTLRALVATRGVRRALSYAAARVRGVPNDLARAMSPELVHAADDAGPEVRVIADGPQTAAALTGLVGRRPVVYLAHNLESGFRGTAALERFERRILRTFSESWMATRADGDSALALAGPGTNVRYVPNVVNTRALKPGPPIVTGRILFLGDFTYAPNREGLEWLLEAVMPAVWASRPDLRLVLAGRGIDTPPADERVETHGFVDDLDALYATVDTVVVPLRTGGGSPLKFIEALARGKPVVATTESAARLEDGVPGTHFLAARDADEFAAAVLELAADRDRAWSIGAAGRALADEAYSIDALAELLAA